MAVPHEETQRREDEAVELRVSGHSYREISRALGFAGPGSAYKALRRAMRKLPVPDVSETRALEITRVEALYSMAWKKAEADGWTPIWFKILLEIVDRLHRLGGLFPVAPAGAHDGKESILDILTSPAFVRWIEDGKHSIAPVVDIDAVTGADVAAVATEPEPGKVVGIRRRLPHDDPESAPCGAEPAVAVQALADRGAATPPAESDEAVRIDPETPGGVNGMSGNSTCGCCAGIGCARCRGGSL